MLRCACRHRIRQQSYESYIYSGIELELAWSKVSTKVCGFTFGSISLHLISKRIKEILTQKHQYNAKYLSRFNDKNAFRNKKIFFLPDLSCMHRHMCVLYTTFLVGEIANRFVGQAQCTGNISFLTKNRQSVFFCLLSKETWIFFNHNIV